MWVCEHTFHVLSSCVALQVVFGSLYRDDVLIKPSRVVSILAAACMLQLVSMLKVRSDLDFHVDFCHPTVSWFVVIYRMA